MILLPANSQDSTHVVQASIIYNKHLFFLDEVMVRRGSYPVVATSISDGSPVNLGRPNIRPLSMVCAITNFGQEILTSTCKSRAWYSRRAGSIPFH